MKRQGTTLDGDEPDKKKSAVPAVGVVARASDTTESATSFNLTDLADDLLIDVYSYLNLKERHVTRRVCHQLLEFVDKSTPGAEELNLNFDVTRTDRVFMRPADAEAVFLRWDFARYPRQGEFTLSTLRSRLPPLRSIRPKKLCFGDLNLGVKGFFAIIMRHLVEQQVARSVTSIILDRLMMPLGPASQMRQACSVFDRASQSGVQSLDLLGGRPEFLLPLAIYSPRLVSLKFNVASCYLGGVETVNYQLLSLQHHPTLREICILGSPLGAYTGTATTPDVIVKVNTQLMTSLASIVKLQKLKFEIDFSDLLSKDPEDIQTAELVRVFGSMLLELKNLRSLSLQLVGPNRFWKCLVESNLASSNIQELSIGHRANQFAEEEVKAMVSGLIKVFPSLNTLEIGHAFVDLSDSMEITIALSGLARHLSLERFEYCRGWLGFEHAAEEEGTFFSNLQQALGKKIQLVLH